MDLSEFSLSDLFRMECESQCRVLTDALVVLEHGGAEPSLLEALMRAAHSLKGAARIVNLDCAVRVAHGMEDLFVAAQDGRRCLSHEDIDRLLAGVDLLTRIGAAGQDAEADFGADADGFLTLLHSPETQVAVAPLGARMLAATAQPTAPQPTALVPADDQRALRVSADNLDHLLGSSAELLVASRKLRSFTDRFWTSHRQQRRIAQGVEAALAACPPDGAVVTALRRVQTIVEEGDRLLMDGIVEMDRFERRASQLAQRLYGEALGCRMRPFSEIATGLRRAARDAARHLGRDVELEILGQGTDVDRDLLEQLESPLGHLIRNAVDHGIESPQERIAAGKSPVGRIRVEASHTAGFLVIRVADDGRGVDLEGLQRRIVERQLSDAETVSRLDQSELLDFLFLPGFSLKGAVSEMSGRGVGLDIVRSLAVDVRGSVRVVTEPTRGTTFSLRFPVSLSVMRALLFEIAGEAYAAPLARIGRVVNIAAREIESVEGRQFFRLEETRVGLVDGADVIGRAVATAPRDNVYLFVLGDDLQRFGVVVNRFLGEGEIVIQPLDSRLGRVRNIAAAALTEEGLPMLLIDVDDFLLSVKRLSLADGHQAVIVRSELQAADRKHILVVEDSLTVREVERKLITSLGYAVETAVDGADGWNAVRSGRFAAVVTDIDMPRMDGFQLTRLIKNDPRLRDIPVIIVSYKDREEDRRRGLDAGADYYLTKGSFQDEGLARAIADVLGAEETP
jgi:two-component system sensor histidine kinase and response regulator WspE